MKRGHYNKAGPGRVWHVRVLEDDAPVVGETIAVARKNGAVDHITVTAIDAADPMLVRFKLVQPDALRTKDEGLIGGGEEDGPIHAPVTPPAPAQGGNADLASALMSAIGQPIITAAAKEAVAGVEARMSGLIEEIGAKVAQLAQQAQQPLTVQLPDLSIPPVTLNEHRHPMFEKVLRLVATNQINVLLVGPAGCGKTHLAAQVAKALGRAYGSLHCTMGMSEGAISGRLLPTDGAAFRYTASEFVNLYQTGNSVFLLDEMDAADPNVLMFLNGALANGALHVPHRLEGAYIPRGQNCAILGAANTFGQGATNLYGARGALDGATLDRFYLVTMDYDPAYEASLTGLVTPPKAPWKASEAPTQSERESLASWVLELRRKASAANLRRIVSTRTLQKALTAQQAGIPVTEIKADLLAGWSADEKVKVGA